MTELPSSEPEISPVILPELTIDSLPEKSIFNLKGADSKKIDSYFETFVARGLRELQASTSFSKFSSDIFPYVQGKSKNRPFRQLFRDPYLDVANDITWFQGPFKDQELRSHLMMGGIEQLIKVYPNLLFLRGGEQKRVFGEMGDFTIGNVENVIRFFSKQSYQEERENPIVAILQASEVMSAYKSEQVRVIIPGHWSNAHIVIKQLDDSVLNPALYTPPSDGGAFLKEVMVSDRVIAAFT